MPSPRFQPQPLVQAIRQGDLGAALEGISRSTRPPALVAAAGALLVSRLPPADRVVVLERLLAAGLSANACPSVPAKGGAQDKPPHALSRSLLTWPQGLEGPRDWGAPLLARAWLDAPELVETLLAAGANPVYGGRQRWFSALAAVAATVSESSQSSWRTWPVALFAEGWDDQAWLGVLTQWVLAPDIESRPLSTATCADFFKACAQYGALPEPSGRDVGRLWHALRFQKAPLEGWRRAGGWLLTLNDEALVRLQTSCLEQDQPQTLYEPALHLALQSDSRLLDRLLTLCPHSPAGRLHPSTGVFPGDASLPAYAPQWLDAGSWLLHGLVWPVEEGVLDRADAVWKKLRSVSLDRSDPSLAMTVWTHGELWGGTSGRSGAPQAWWERHRVFLAPHPLTGRNAFHRATSVDRMRAAQQVGVDLSAVDAEGNQAFVCLVVGSLSGDRPRALAWCTQLLEHHLAPLDGKAWGRTLASWVEAHPALKRVYKTAWKALHEVPVARALPADAVQVACFHLDAPRLKKLLARAPNRMQALTYVDQKGQTPLGALCQAPVGRGLDKDKMARVLALLSPAPVHVQGQTMHPVVALLHRNVSGNDTVLPDEGWEGIFAKAGQEAWPAAINRLELADALASWWRRNRTPSSGRRNASVAKFSKMLRLLQVPREVEAEVVMRVLEQDVERQPTQPHNYRREADRLDEQETQWLFEAFENAERPINPSLLDGKRLRLASGKTAEGHAATPDMFDHPLLLPALRQQSLGESWAEPVAAPETSVRRRF